VQQVSGLRYLYAVNPTVSIVIPCLNEVAYIERCVRSTMTQTYPNEHIHVVVADGGSNDGTLQKLIELAGVFPQLVVVDNPKRFTPVALNLGVNATASDVVVILGAHAELSADFVERCIDALTLHPDAGCVGGIIENVHENHTAAIVSRAMQSPFGVGNARFRTGGNAGYVDTVAFGAYRREAFQTIGLFDEDLVRNQDDEFNYRLTKAGYKVWFEPEIRSKYYVRASYKKLFRQYFQYGYWKVFVNRKHKAVTTWRQLVPFAFVLWLVTASVLSAISASFVPLLTLPALIWLLAALAAGIVMGTPSRDLPGLTLSFFILHAAYGLGYGRGIFDFLLLRRMPAADQHTLSR